MMNGSINIDPEQVMARGNNVKSIFDEYVSIRNSIMKIVDEIQAAWEGSDSAGYITAIHNYDDDFKLLGDTIHQLGDILYRHGNRTAQSRDTIMNIASRL